MKNILLLAVLLIGNLSVEAQSQALEQLVDRYVEEYEERYNTFGLAIGIIHGGYDYHYYYGQLSEDFPFPPNDSTTFAIGGISKVFTAQIMLECLAEYKISPDTSIAYWLPDSLRKGPLSSLSFTDLATHTAGFKKLPNNLPPASGMQKYFNYDKKLFGQYLRFSAPFNLKKASYHHSHVGYGLLGWMLENVSQTDYHQLFQNKISIPLQLENTSLYHTENIAIGHSFSGFPTLPQYANSLAPALSFVSSLPDMLSYVNHHLSETTDRLTASTNAMQVSIEKTHQKNVSTSYGWHLIQQKKQATIFTHSGNTEGYKCFIAFIKDTQTAVVILSNSEQPVDEMGFELIELINR